MWWEKEAALGRCGRAILRRGGGCGGGMGRMIREERDRRLGVVCKYAEESIDV